jgi:hypothetical protein
MPDKTITITKRIFLMDQLHQRFLQAVTICTNDDSIKQRLAQAWVEQLDDIRLSQLPHATRNDFEELRAALYCETPYKTEHPAQAAIRKMSVSQAAEHTATILSIYRELINIDTEYRELERKASGAAAEVRLDKPAGRLLN